MVKLTVANVFSHDQRTANPETVPETVNESVPTSVQTTVPSDTVEPDPVGQLGSVVLFVVPAVVTL